MTKGFNKKIGPAYAALWFGGLSLIRIAYTKKGTGGDTGIATRLSHNGWRHWALGANIHADFLQYGWSTGFVINFLTLSWRFALMLGFQRPEYKEEKR